MTSPETFMIYDADTEYIHVFLQMQFLQNSLTLLGENVTAHEKKSILPFR